MTSRNVWLSSPLPLYGAAFALRLVMFSFPTLTDIFLQRVELATPVTSYKRLTEGIFLYSSHVPPYDGGLFHQAPLLLAMFSFLTSIPGYYIVPVVYSAADLAIAYCLQTITRLKQIRDQDQPKLPIEKESIRPALVAALYLFNPFTLMSCMSRSTIIFTNLSIAMAIVSALRGRQGVCAFWVALATYLSLYPVMLIAPLGLILFRNSKEAVPMMALFVSAVAGLLVVSRWIVGSWDFMQATYGMILFLSDLTPNVGMFWYFFIELFDQFRSFFMVVFQFHVFIFVIPLCIKLKERPLFIVTILCGIMAVFKSYPAAGDAAFYLGLVPIHSELFKYSRYGFLITNIFMYSSVLSPIFWYLWLYAGSGNANFFYAITLVYNLGQVLLLIDLVYASLRRDFDIQHPESIGKRVIQK